MKPRQPESPQALADRIAAEYTANVGQHAQEMLAAYRAIEQEERERIVAMLQPRQPITEVNGVKLTPAQAAALHRVRQQ